MPEKTFDSKCYDLAALFIGDTRYAGNEDMIIELAIEIQQTIEDFLEDLGEEESDE